MHATLRVTGDKELVRKFDQLPPKLQRKGVRRGVTKAGRIVVKAAKAEAPKETRLLSQSLGSRVFQLRDKTGYGAVVGVRKGFRKPVVRGRRGFRKARKKESSDVYRNPEKYLHLILLGHRIARGGTLARTSGKRLGKAEASRATGKRGQGVVAGFVKPNNFLLRAAKKTNAQCVRVIGAECRVELEKERATRH